MHSILELLTFRIFAVKAVKEIDAQAKAGIPLRADQLEDLHRNVVARNQIKEDLIRKIEPHLDLVNHPKKVKTDADHFHYLQTLAIGYTLSDNYQDFVETIQKNPTLRRIANEENSSFDKQKKILRKTVSQFFSPKFHRPTLRGARRYSDLDDSFDAKVAASTDLQFFKAIIENSATFDYLKNQADFDRVTYDIEFFFKRLVGSKRVFPDIIHDSLAKTVSGISKVFGNTVGKFQSRRGLLYGTNSITAGIQVQLRPGDILLEKTPFRLTDRFIPGYWGHNAIWLGTEEELRALGVWEHPKIQAIADRIRAGQSILEALRPGVTTNRLEHFLDIDSFAVLRRPDISIEEQRNVVIRAASQYGKAYDFGFDVETQDTLVCSELMFMTYTDIQFRLEKMLGRYTINPDSVAEASVKGILDVVALAKDGQFEQGDLRESMRKLIGAPLEMLNSVRPAQISQSDATPKQVTKTDEYLLQKEFDR